MNILIAYIFCYDYPYVGIYRRIGRKNGIQNGIHHFKKYCRSSSFSFRGIIAFRAYFTSSEWNIFSILHKKSRDPILFLEKLAKSLSMNHLCLILCSILCILSSAELTYRLIYLTRRQMQLDKLHLKQLKFSHTSNL